VAEVGSTLFVDIGTCIIINSHRHNHPGNNHKHIWSYLPNTKCMDLFSNITGWNVLHDSWIYPISCNIYLTNVGYTWCSCTLIEVGFSWTEIKRSYYLREKYNRYSRKRTSSIPFECIFGGMCLKYIGENILILNKTWVLFLRRV
jgi:hypothetical protein